MDNERDRYPIFIPHLKKIGEIPPSLNITTMKKVISSIGISKSHPEWSYLNFKPYRNVENEVVIPEAQFMLTADVEELKLVVGDVVA
ncbi:MAG: hypothetical protein M0R17_04440 [Candidatus Omnitrophica bacterium]|nr:hypothetical protein [Candidatus Omnitrophota bacterium]